jgi:hypothetical protein
VLTFIEESACAQVISNSVSFAISRPIGMLDHITICRKTSKSKSPKAVGKQSTRKQAVSSMAVASVTPSEGETGLMIYSHAEARHSTRRVIQFLENLKDVESDRIGNQSSFATLGF